MSKSSNDTDSTIDRVPINTPVKKLDDTLSVDEQFTDNAIHNILPARYLLRDTKGNVIEKPHELFERVAQNVAKGEHDSNIPWYQAEANEEKWADEFQYLMENQLFMPNSPCLMNAGAPLQQLSACFVVEPKDDMESIFESAKQAALIFKSGGGVGYTFSHLRPHGATVSSTGGVSSGPLSFMEVFNSVCNTVKQGGKRRGAQMAILRVDHADIGRFACAKRTEGDFDNFNISVAVTDEFVEAVEAGEEYIFYDPETDYEDTFIVPEATANFYNPQYANNPIDWEDAENSDREGKLVKENFWRDYADDIEAWDDDVGESVPIAEKWGMGEIELTEGDVMQLPARFIMDLIIDGAWRNGEPGLFNLDATNNDHSFDVEKYPKHKINATNPCAEQPLSNFEACNLGHINLSLMVDDLQGVTYDQWKIHAADEYTDWDGLTTEERIDGYVGSVLDYDTLDRVITSGTRFLDNVVTMSEFPLEQIDERVNGQRKIGLGIMGFAQMLFQMGIPYGSEESAEVARNVMRYIDWQSKQASHSLAKERGSFEYWDESKYASPMEYPEWFEKHTYEDPADWEDGYPIRNHNTTTIAPTGTTSMLADTTGGCEPAFNVANYKNVGDDIQGDDMLVEFDDYFSRTLAANGFDPDDVKAEAEDLMATNDFEGPHDLSIPDSLADVFVTTNDLSSTQHTRMQRAFQEFVDSGISKTINAPNSATRNDAYTAFMFALDSNPETIGNPAKGLTFYRDGSRDEQVLTLRRDNNLDEVDADDAEVLVRAQELIEDAGHDNVASVVTDMLHQGTGAIDELDDTEKITDACPECGEEMDPDGEGCTICPGCFFSPCAK